MQHINSDEEATYTTGIMAGMPKPGDYKARAAAAAATAAAAAAPSC